MAGTGVLDPFGMDIFRPHHMSDKPWLRRPVGSLPDQPKPDDTELPREAPEHAWPTAGNPA
ncbi:hypothetical protein TNCT6_59020 [Streptomyces sp. 6-11-2]|nr:hypothetical protein TNCT6_59020 [Streptomyces sp. 6-11-2]